MFYAQSTFEEKGEPVDRRNEQTSFRLTARPPKRLGHQKLSEVRTFQPEAGQCIMIIINNNSHKALSLRCTGKQIMSAKATLTYILANRTLNIVVNHKHITEQTITIIICTSRDLPKPH